MDRTNYEVFDFGLFVEAFQEIAHAFNAMKLGDDVVKGIEGAARNEGYHSLRQALTNSDSNLMYENIRWSMSGIVF